MRYTVPITSVPRPYQRLGHLAIGQTTRTPVPVLAAVSYILHNMKRYSSQVGRRHWLCLLPSYRFTWERDNFRRTFKEDSKCWMVSSWALTRLLNLGESSRHPFKSRAGISLVIVDIAVYTLGYKEDTERKRIRALGFLLAHLYTPFRLVGMILIFSPTLLIKLSLFTYILDAVWV